MTRGRLILMPNTLDFGVASRYFGSQANFTRFLGRNTTYHSFGPRKYVLARSLTFGWQQWKAYQQANELADIDVQILSSDLPIDAYLDRGFQTWLTRYQP